MKKFVAVFLISVINLGSFGQSAMYSLTGIPEALKSKASVIVHEENIDLKVENIGNATLSVHKVFTVLNDDGRQALTFNEFSSKNILLEEAEIKVYDRNGKVKEKHKKRDMLTTAIGEGLIDDGYVTYYRISTNEYPVTVEYNYEQKFKNTLNLPDYKYIHIGEAVLQSNFTARIPAEVGLRYKGFNTAVKPVISDDGNYKVYNWTVKNISPIDYEEGAVSANNKYPYVALAPDNFSYYGFNGNLSSWKSFGSWINQLYKDLDVLPANRQQFFQQLVKDAASDKEKIERIYSYMQQNFRYVSIQLGVGGLKPFSAEFTDQKKYGDCKALSNYMKAALKSVGIKSYVAIINSDYNAMPVDPAFPSNDFNHVILCVPAKDSIWLECTSSTIGFGELGTFTENKNALLITEEGGMLVPTPVSHFAANIFSTVTTLSIADDLSAQSETILTGKGEFKEILDDLIKANKDEQKQGLVSVLGFKQPDDFEWKKTEGAYGASKLNMSIRSVPEFKAGSKLFINPRVYKIWSKRLPKSEERKSDFYFRFPFQKIDTTIFKLPPGVKSDVLPKDKDIKCRYAMYTSKAWFNETENAIYSVTSLVLNKHQIPVQDFAAVKTFFDDVIKDDAQRIVVKK